MTAPTDTEINATYSEIAQENGVDESEYSMRVEYLTAQRLGIPAQRGKETQTELCRVICDAINAAVSA